MSTDPAFVAAVNAARPASRPVAADPRCEQTAAFQVIECAAVDVQTHDRRDGLTLRNRADRFGLTGAVGECVAQGDPPPFPNPPLWHFAEWRDEPPPRLHWKILTDPAYPRIGLAVATNPTSGRPYAVAVLAGPDAAETPIVPFPVPQPPARVGWLSWLFGWLRP